MRVVCGMSERRRIGDFMTPLPHVIGVTHALRTAVRTMQHLGVRHLPVTDPDGRLVGVLSHREATNALERGADPERTTVEAVMTPEPFAVAPDAPLSSVARQMASERVGSAIVVDDGKVVGVLTTTDALGILADLLTGYLGPREDDLKPSEVRERIRGEHQVLKELLRKVEGLASRTLEGDEDAAAELGYASRRTYQLLLRHVDLEDRLLVPALREGGARGRRLADRLEEEHGKQRAELREALSALDARAEGNPAPLAQRMLGLVEAVRNDIAHEEKDVLNEQLLRDDPMLADLFTG